MRSACQEGSTSEDGRCAPGRSMEAERVPGLADPQGPGVLLFASPLPHALLPAGVQVPAPQSLCTCTRSTDVRSRAAAHCATWRPHAGGRAQPSQQLRTKVRLARRRSGQVSRQGAQGAPGAAGGLFPAFPRWPGEPAAGLPEARGFPHANLVIVSVVSAQRFPTAG